MAASVLAKQAARAPAHAPRRGKRLSYTEEMPVGQVLRNNQATEMAPERLNLPPGHALLHRGEEPIVGVLQNGDEALVVVRLVQRHLRLQSDPAKQSAQPDERPVDPKRDGGAAG